MLNFQEKRRLRAVLYSRITLLVLVVIILALGYSVWGVYQKASETGERKDKQVAELEELQMRAAVLQAELDRLNTQRGVEEEIRSKFDVGKAGERAMVIVDENSDEEEGNASEKRGFFARLVDFF